MIWRHSTLSQQKGSAGYKVGPKPIVINGVKLWCPYKWPEINGLSGVSSPRNQWSDGAPTGSTGSGAQLVESFAVYWRE